MALTDSPKYNDLVEEAIRFIERDAQLPNTAYDEIIPGLFVSEAGPALNKEKLRVMGVTHVLNCCEGTHRTQVATGPSFYLNEFAYMGIPAMDAKVFSLSPYFQAANE